MNEPVIHPAPLDDDISALLAASGLPTADLAAGNVAELFVLRDADGVAGVIGIEVLDGQGLLRSLAVAGRRRGEGLGHRLVAHLEQWSTRQGLHDLYLLTTTAAEFFERLGYERLARADAPAVVMRSEQFASLCPATAALLHKRLGSSPPGPRIVRYQPGHKHWFESLNREWLERWFTVEDKDRHYFEDPEATILAPGGAIFMAVDGDRPVGTAAAIRHADGSFELAKMAVTPSAQGRGVGGLLVDAVLGFAAGQGARTVVLFSDTRLPAAIRLYERRGFRHAPLPRETGYARGDIFMIRELEV